MTATAQPPRPTVLSLFSGAGGLDLGFRRAGFDIVAGCECDKTIWETYAYNHPTPLIKGDIREIPSSAFPFCDGIIGGPPCQSWTTAGAFRGIDDARGRLVYDYIRVIRDKNPKFFLMENVRGMLAPRHARALAGFVDAFRSCGYNVSTILANAADYGVAQDRKRVFIIGFRSDLGVQFTFPVGSTAAGKKITLRDAIWDLQDSAVPAAAGNRHNDMAVNNNEYYTGDFTPFYRRRNKVRTWDDQAYTVLASGGRCQLHPRAPKMIRHTPNDFRFVVGAESLYRRMTIRELARIQGFPDDFSFFYTRVDDGYKMVGNAVPVNMAYEIAVAIKTALSDLDLPKPEN